VERRCRIETLEQLPDTDLYDALKTYCNRKLELYLRIVKILLGGVLIREGIL
jgi:hypothetical protein